LRQFGLLGVHKVWAVDEKADVRAVWVSGGLSLARHHQVEGKAIGSAQDCEGILAAHGDRFEAEMAGEEAGKSRDFRCDEVEMVQFHGLCPVAVETRTGLAADREPVGP